MFKKKTKIERIKCLLLMFVRGIYTNPTDAYKAVYKASLRDYSVWTKVTADG
jgi:hypothetical protein